MREKGKTLRKLKEVIILVLNYHFLEQGKAQRQKNVETICITWAPMSQAEGIWVEKIYLRLLMVS